MIPNLPIGNALGELTDETLDYGDNINIRKFCSIGPKTYSFILSNGKEEVKAKGCPKGDHGLTYEIYKRMVKSEAREIVHKFRLKLHFVRNKFDSTISKGDMEKRVQMTYDKRIIEKNYKTRPFGTMRYNVIQSTNYFNV